MSLILLNQLESESGGVCSSLVGVNGQRYGTSGEFTQAKFNNGFGNTTASRMDGIVFNNWANGGSLTKFTLEWWMKIGYSGFNDDMAFCWGQTDGQTPWSVNQEGGYISFNNDGNRFAGEGPGFYYQFDNSNYIYRYSSGFRYRSLNELIHLAIAVDLTTDPVGVKMFDNGNEITLTNGDAGTPNGIFSSNFLKLGWLEEGGLDILLHHYYDNVKVYADFKTDFSDRENELAGVPVTPRRPRMN